MASLNASAILELAEKQAYEFLRRERELNAVVERRCPGLKPTAVYERGPLPPSDPRFNSWADYVTHLAKIEMAKFDPNVKVDP